MGTTCCHKYEANTYGAPVFIMCQQLFISTPQIKWGLVSIKYSAFKAVGLPLLLGKSGGDDLLRSSCNHDGETRTDLQIPEGVIFLTASKPVFLFLNNTYWSNKKQVWGWNTTLTHCHISPFTQ